MTLLNAQGKRKGLRENPTGAWSPRSARNHGRCAVARMGTVLKGISRLGNWSQFWHSSIHIQAIAVLTGELLQEAVLDGPGVDWAFSELQEQ